jgi:hypothetical protein
MPHVVTFIDKNNLRKTVTTKVLHLNEFEVVFKLHGILRIIELRFVEHLLPVTSAELAIFLLDCEDTQAREIAL